MQSPPLTFGYCQPPAMAAETFVVTTNSVGDSGNYLALCQAMNVTGPGRGVPAWACLRPHRR